MSGNWGKWKKTAAIVLAASMAVPVGAAAESEKWEELNTILETQQEQAQRSLLERTLGYEELSDAIEEKGLALYTKLGLTEETKALLRLTEEVPTDMYLELGMQVDPQQKKWQLAADAGLEADQSVLDLFLYGDKDQLALCVPQFCEEAVALRSGSFWEQYHGSVLEQMAGELPAGFDVSLDFFPEFEGMIETDASAKALEAMAEEFESGIQVESKEENGQAIYTVILQKHAVMKLARNMIWEYMRILNQADVFSMRELLELESDMDEALDQTALMLEDELNVDFYVKDNLVTQVQFDLNLDRNRAESRGSGEYKHDPDEVVDMSCVLVFRNPKNLREGFDMTISAANGDWTEQAGANVSLKRELADEVETTTLSLTAGEDGETLFNSEIYRSAFDAKTGDYDMRLQVDADGEEVAYLFDGTFTEIEKGTSFVLNMDELSIQADGEKVGIAGEFFMGSDPGEIAAPQAEKMLLELTQAELFALATEIQINAQTWMQQFAPEPKPSSERYDELEPSSEVYDELKLSSEMYEEQLSGDRYQEPENSGLVIVEETEEELVQVNPIQERTVQRVP